MLDNFACARCRFVLEPLEPLQLRAFAGATLRGGFGHAFKRVVCIWPPGDCPRCLLRHTCSYPYIFETAPPPGAEKLRNLDQVPRPFVIEPPPGPSQYLPGERLEFRLVLVGRAIDYLPYFVFTFQRLGEMGLGRGRGRYRLLEVHNESQSIFTTATGTLDTRIEQLTFDDLPPPAERRLRIRFLTPTRIRNDGALRTELTFQDLIRALLRRISSLNYFHCGRELRVDFRGLIEQALTVRTVHANLSWQDQDRFSGRQRQRIEMGGLTGDVKYEAEPEQWRTFWPLLKAGECVHVGKGAVMGLGKYCVGGGR